MSSSTAPMPLLTGITKKGPPSPRRLMPQPRIEEPAMASRPTDVPISSRRLGLAAIRPAWVLVAIDASRQRLTDAIIAAQMQGRIVCTALAGDEGYGSIQLAASPFFWMSQPMCQSQIPAAGSTIRHLHAEGPHASHRTIRLSEATVDL